MAFKFKDGHYKGKSYLYVQRIDPWYIRDLPKNDPLLWENLSQKQKNLCAMVKVEADDEVVDALVDKIDSGVTKSELEIWFKNNKELSKGLPKTTQTKYIQLAKKKYTLNFENRQKDVIATHAWRYEEMYEESMERERQVRENPPENMKPHVIRQIQIDSLYTAAELLHAKERMFGLHDRAYMVSVRNIVDKESKESGRYLKHRIDTSRMGIDRLAKLIVLLEKYSYKDTQIKQEVKVKQGEVERRKDSMVDWDEIEKEQGNVVEKKENDLTIEKDTPVKRIALEKPPKKTEGKTLKQIEESIDKTAKERLKDALKKAGSKTVK